MCETLTHPVAKITASASSELPSSNRRPSGAKRAIWASFLSLIFPSIISWLAPTSAIDVSRQGVPVDPIGKCAAERCGVRTKVIPAGLAPREQQETRAVYARVETETDSTESVQRLSSRHRRFIPSPGMTSGRTKYGPVLVLDVYNDPSMKGLLKVVRERRVDAIGDVWWWTALVIES